jgi:hypothetical protein
MSCASCDEHRPARAICRHSRCHACTKQALISSFDRVAIPDVYSRPNITALRNAVVDRTAAILPFAAVEKWKEGTSKKYLDELGIIEAWGEDLGIQIVGTAPCLDKLVVAALYIDRVDEGEGVAPSTADKMLTALNHWYSEFQAIFPEHSAAMTEHPVKNSLIDDLKKRARMWFQENSVQKVGIEIGNLENFFGNGSISGDWQYDHSRLAAGIMFFFLARSIAAAHLVWRGNHEGPIASASSDISWRHDPSFGAYMRCDVGRDKTLRMAENCNRFLPDDNGSSINFSKYVRDYIREYKLPSGTFLLAVRRKKDGSFHPSKFTNWGRVVDNICDRLRLDREDHGTQSFRRGCAEWLSSRNANFEEIGLLGFWRSAAVRIYTGVQAAPRLSIWNSH